MAPPYTNAEPVTIVDATGAVVGGLGGGGQQLIVALQAAGVSPLAATYAQPQFAAQDGNGHNIFVPSSPYIRQPGGGLSAQLEYPAGDASGSTGIAAAGLLGLGASQLERIRLTSNAGDAIVTGLLAQGAYVLNPASAGWERVRTPTIWKGSTTINLGGNTAIWTPATGKKFRLLGYLLGMMENSTLAVAGGLSVTLVDGAATVIVAAEWFVPAAAFAGIGAEVIPPVNLLPNGYLSTTANNVLSVNLSASLATGNIFIQVWGTEE